MSEKKLPAHIVLIDECQKAMIALNSGKITYPDECFRLNTQISGNTPLEFIALMTLPKILGKIPIPQDEKSSVVETLRLIKKKCRPEHQEALFPKELFEKILK